MNAEHVAILCGVGAHGVLLFEGLSQSEESIPNDRGLLEFQAFGMARIFSSKSASTSLRLPSNAITAWFTISR